MTAFQPISVFALLLAFSFGPVALAEGAQWVSFEHLDLGPEERVVGFEVHVDGGVLASFPNVPKGWYVEIGNDASGFADIKGNVQVGSAALGYQFFKSFLKIENAHIPDRPLALRAEITVSKDFVNARLIKPGPSQILVVDGR